MTSRVSVLRLPDASATLTDSRAVIRLPRRSARLIVTRAVAESEILKLLVAPPATLLVIALSV